MLELAQYEQHRRVDALIGVYTAHVTHFLNDVAALSKMLPPEARVSIERSSEEICQRLNQLQLHMLKLLAPPENKH